ncbi:MAG: DNA damage-inducible protein D [Porphyromonas sp.]|uniref:DNA damage-inducible protein D n=1 Tax=Porphyromonas sp. TaxID=1924944 RepID=UPI001CAF4CA7|nr:DNA damage-inducible protein D [Porphyromonas sp.]MBF1371088.1 DNA damage-inducible protein D [Porphyromonas sp.]
MKPSITQAGQSLFDEIRHIDDAGVEYWKARELAKALSYTDYRNFLSVIKKAQESCRKSGHKVENHFVDVNEMVSIAYGVQREIDDTRLSRYACYLIVQNADPSKKIVALGQTYFAVQTRTQEQYEELFAQLSEEEQKRLLLREEMTKHNTQLAAAAHDAGVKTSLDYAVFQNHGYRGLYGGLEAKDIHARKRLKKSQQILDHMGSTELAANLFRATQTEEKLKRDKIKGKQNANRTHEEIGAKVRQTIKEIGGTMPEDLPVEDSIKQIEKKLKPTTKRKKSIK